MKLFIRNGTNYFLTLLIFEVQRLFPFTAKINNKTKQKCAWLLFGVVLLPLIILKSVRFTIPYLELVVTEFCNLHCDGCSNLMPFYKAPRHVDIEMLKASLDKILACSHIEELTLLGGEPFVYPHLNEIIDYAVSHKKIKRVKIISNGSFIPKVDVLKSLKNPKVFVSISVYNMTLNTDLDDVLSLNDIKNELHYFVNWNDYGGIHKRGLSSEELKRSFKSCASVKCKTLAWGKLFACPRAAHLVGIGVIDESADTNIDIMNTPIPDLKKQMKNMYKISATPACDYCNPVWQRTAIRAGVQKGKP